MIGTPWEPHHINKPIDEPVMSLAFKFFLPLQRVNKYTLGEYSEYFYSLLPPGFIRIN